MSQRCKPEGKGKNPQTFQVLKLSDMEYKRGYVQYVQRKKRGAIKK